MIPQRAKPKRQEKDDYSTAWHDTRTPIPTVQAYYVGQCVEIRMYRTWFSGTIRYVKNRAVFVSWADRQEITYLTRVGHTALDKIRVKGE